MTTQYDLVLGQQADTKLGKAGGHKGVRATWEW